MEIWMIIAISGGVAIFVLLSVFIIALIVKKHKPENADISYIKSLLPGVNCGACGREYCAKFAKDIAQNKAKAEECPLLSFENRAKIDGDFRGDAIANVKQVAVVKCKGGNKCPNVFEYTGAKSCQSQNKIQSGSKSCPYACLGCGDCVKACPFSAISITERGVAYVDPEVCTGCGNCVVSCPNKLIDLIPYTQRVVIGCNNQDDTPANCFNCKVGCIKCNHCTEICPVGAISIENGVPVISEEKCIHCYKCVRVCPNHCITRI